MRKIVTEQTKMVKCYEKNLALDKSERIAALTVIYRFFPGVKHAEQIVKEQAIKKIIKFCTRTK